MLKYYKYKKSIYTIEVFDPEDDRSEGSLIKVYEIDQFGSTYKNRLNYYTTENNKIKLIRNLKNHFAKEYKLLVENIIEATILPINQDMIGKRKIQLRIELKS